MTEPVALCSQCCCELNTEKTRQYVRLICPQCNTVFLEYVNKSHVESLPEFLQRHEERWQQIRKELADLRRFVGVDSEEEL